MGFVIKAKRNDDLRRFTVDSLSWTDIFVRLQNLFALKDISVTYTDADDDEIIVASQDELEAAVEEGSTLRFTVRERFEQLGSQSGLGTKNGFKEEIIELPMVPLQTSDRESFTEVQMVESEEKMTVQPRVEQIDEIPLGHASNDSLKLAASRDSPELAKSTGASSDSPELEAATFPSSDKNCLHPASELADFLAERMRSVFTSVLDQRDSGAARTVSTKLPSQPDPVHSDIICDVCQGAVAGVRYKCGHCIDYDLCETCEAQSQHDPTHILLKVRTDLDIDSLKPLLPKFRSGCSKRGTHCTHEPSLPVAPVTVPQTQHKPEGAIPTEQEPPKTAVPQCEPHTLLGKRPVPQLAPQSLGMQFLRDVTYPSRSIVCAGKPFRKIWLVRNNSQVAWGTATCLVPYRVLLTQDMRSSSQTLMQRKGWQLPGALLPLLVGHVAPHVEQHISVTLTAPAFPCRYIICWCLCAKHTSASSLDMHADLWCDVTVEPQPSFDSDSSDSDNVISPDSSDSDSESEVTVPSNGTLVPEAPASEKQETAQPQEAVPVHPLEEVAAQLASMGFASEDVSWACNECTQTPREELMATLLDKLVSAAPAIPTQPVRQISPSEEKHISDKLVEMGFFDKTVNEPFISRFGDNIPAISEALLSKYSEDYNWSMS